MITASVNIAPLLARLSSLGHATRRPMRALVTEQARLFVSSGGQSGRGMIQVTPPHSAGVRGLAARRQGENAVLRDIRTVYATEGTEYGRIPDPRIRKAWWKAVKAGDTAEAARLLQHFGAEVNLPIRTFDGGAAHRNRRISNTGRIRGRHPDMIVTDIEELRKYEKTVLARVGTLAGGFNAAARALGANGVPSWVSRHGTRFSGIRIEANDSSFYIIMSDRVPFGGSGTEYRIRYVLGYRAAALDRAMPHIIRRAVKLAGFATSLS